MCVGWFMSRSRDAPFRRAVLNLIVFLVFSVSLFPCVLFGWALWCVWQCFLSTFLQWWVGVLLLPFAFYLVFAFCVFSVIVGSGWFIRAFHLYYEPGVFEYRFADDMTWRWLVVCSLYTPCRKLMEMFPVGPVKNYYYRLLGMKIGEESLIGGVIKDPCLTEVGKKCTIGEYAVIYGHIHTVADSSLLMQKVVIGNRCVIGAGAFVMPGAVLEDDVVVAAGSVVRKGQVLTSGGVYGGVPAKKISSKS